MWFHFSQHWLPCQMSFLFHCLQDVYSHFCALKTEKCPYCKLIHLWFFTNWIFLWKQYPEHTLLQAKVPPACLLKSVLPNCQFSWLLTKWIVFVLTFCINGVKGYVLFCGRILLHFISESHILFLKSSIFFALRHTLTSFSCIFLSFIIIVPGCTALFESLVWHHLT